MKKFQLLTLGLAFFLLSRSQDRTLYEKQLFIQGDDTLPCRILTPENYNPKKKYPRGGIPSWFRGKGE